MFCKLLIMTTTTTTTAAAAAATTTTNHNNATNNIIVNSNTHNKTNQIRRPTRATATATAPIGMTAVRPPAWTDWRRPGYLYYYVYYY